MGKPWLVFGGWAISPDILRPIFGEESAYVDINEIVPMLVDGELLIENWAEVVKKKVDEYLTMDIAGIAGWSTGAIIACALVKQVPVKKLVLLSATPSFCRKEGFRFGQRASIVQVMINKLKDNNNHVVKDFLIQCGLQGNQIMTKFYGEQTLIKGLRFLEKANLIGALKKMECETLVVHGRDDKIIPYQAGEALAGMIGAEYKLLNGGHAFYTDLCYEVKRMIE
jgi:pimeloyl-ACP methyl ester carboxylesterase